MLVETIYRLNGSLRPVWFNTGISGSSDNAVIPNAQARDGANDHLRAENNSNRLGLAAIRRMTDMRVCRVRSNDLLAVPSRWKPVAMVRRKSWMRQPGMAPDCPPSARSLATASSSAAFAFVIPLIGVRPVQLSPSYPGYLAAALPGENKQAEE